ncbi:MAG: hypothetical protein ACR2NG_00315 [Acidimicrobiia bacterium]
MIEIIVALGETDCERIGEGTLAQPVNAISSLAFSAIGLALLIWAGSAVGWERRFRYVTAGLFIVTGFGSFLYHGPQWAGSLFAHDITFLAVLAVIAGTHITLALGRDERTAWIAIGALIALYVATLLVWPTATNFLTASAVVLLVAGDIPLHRRGGLDGGWYTAALFLIVLAVVFLGLGRSGAPLCDPESAFQPHGLWHILSAAALGAYVVGTAPVRVQMEAN